MRQTQFTGIRENVKVNNILSVAFYSIIFFKLILSEKKFFFNFNTGITLINKALQFEKSLIVIGHY